MQKLRPALVATVIIMATAIRLDSGVPAGSAEAPTSALSASSAADSHPSESERSATSSTDAPAPRPTATSAAAGISAGDAVAAGASSAAVVDPSSTAANLPSAASPADVPSAHLATAPRHDRATSPTTTPVRAPAPTSPPPAPPAPAPSGSPQGSTAMVSPSAPEAQVLSLINGERARQGLPPLQLNGAAMSVARSWTSYMAAHTLDHNPNLVGDLARAGVGDWRWIGENVGQAQSVDQVYATFLGSPMHRANILGAHFSQVGIGVATNGDQVFVTMDFLGW